MKGKEVEFKRSVIFREMAEAIIDLAMVVIPPEENLRYISIDVKKQKVILLVEEEETSGNTELGDKIGRS
jgi:hypothetical protein